MLWGSRRAVSRGLHRRSCASPQTTGGQSLQVRRDAPSSMHRWLDRARGYRRTAVVLFALSKRQWEGAELASMPIVTTDDGVLPVGAGGPEGVRKPVFWS